MDKLIWYDSDGRINCRRGYEVALARLASYEATGMMPDEIVRMGMAYEDSKRYSGRLELKLMPYLNIGLSPDELKALMLATRGRVWPKSRRLTVSPLIASAIWPRPTRTGAWWCCRARWAIRYIRCSAEK